jgi:hypothetical protein
MSKSLITICLLAASAFLMIGGCTPEANKTWSENADLAWDYGAMTIYDWSGTYGFMYDDAGRLDSMALFQTGTSLQGYDNQGRTWNGYITGSTGPVETVTTDSVPETINTTGGGQIHLETGDASSEVLTGNVGIYTDLLGGQYKAVNGEHITSGGSGYFLMVGPGVGAATE